MVDMFDHRKIKQIRKMPDGDGMIVIWLQILCLAGNINRDGAVYFTEQIPYTDAMMATAFDSPLALVQMALTIFSRFGMIEIVDDIIYVKNWEKYQNLEGLQRVREQTRERVSAYRERQKLTAVQADEVHCNSDATLSNVTCNATVTHGNATDIDTDVDIDTDKKREDAPKVKPIRHQCGEYHNVLLTDDDLAKLKAEFTDWEARIKRLDEYIESKGAKYKNHLVTIRAWARRDAEATKGRPSREVGAHRYDQRQYTEEQLDHNTNELIREARERKGNA